MTGSMRVRGASSLGMGGGGGDNALWDLEFLLRWLTDTWGMPVGVDKSWGLWAKDVAIYLRGRGWEGSGVGEVVVRGGGVKSADTFPD